MRFDLSTPIRTKYKALKVLFLCLQFVALVTIVWLVIVDTVYAPDTSMQIAVLRDLVTAGGIVIGGWWTYSMFIQRREQETALLRPA